jgi:dodecin
MALMKVIEVLTESPKSWEDAAQQAVDEAGKTVRGIRSVYIKEFEAKVDGDRITQYRINAKVTFEIEGSDSGGGRGRSAGAGKGARRRG